MRRVRGRRASGEQADSFGVSLMDLLTTALGCVLLIFIVYSVVTSGDLQRFLAQNTDLVESLKERDRIIAVKEADAQVLQAAVDKLKEALSAQELAALEAQARIKREAQERRVEHATSLKGLLGELGQLRAALDPQTARPVDVMLVIDGTNSMEPSLQAVRQNLRAIVGALKVLSPTARVGVTVYRDVREPPEIRLEHQPLSEDANVLKRFLEGIEAKSTKADSDRPEWMCGGLRAAILGVDQAETSESRASRKKQGRKSRRRSRRKSRRTSKRKSRRPSKSQPHVEWRDRAIKLVIVVSDAGSNSPKARECIEVAAQFRKKGGQVHVVSTLPKYYRQRAQITREYDREVLRDHASVAKAGGGEHIQRAAESTLLEEVLRSAFRSRLAELEELKAILRRGEDLRTRSLSDSDEE